MDPNPRLQSDRGRWEMQSPWALSTPEVPYIAFSVSISQRGFISNGFNGFYIKLLFVTKKIFQNWNMNCYNTADDGVSGERIRDLEFQLGNQQENFMTRMRDMESIIKRQEEMIANMKVNGEFWGEKNSTVCQENWVINSRIGNARSKLDISLQFKIYQRE